MNGESSVKTLPFGKEVTLMGEVIITGRKVGAGKAFWANLAHSESLFAEVVAFVDSWSASAVFHLNPTIDRDMTGWKCVESIPAEGEFEFSLTEFFRKGESGEEMVKRANAKCVVTSLRHLEAMLREQDKIPEELRKFVLVSNEVWLGPDSSRSVFYLCWNDERWYLHYGRLKDDFDSYYRLVVPRKYQK